MNISKRQLKQIIKEEVNKVFLESAEKWLLRFWEKYANDDPEVKLPPSADNEVGYRRHPAGLKAEEVACSSRTKLRGGIRDCWTCARTGALIFHEPARRECSDVEGR